MVKVGGPLMSLEAHGWLGRSFYGRTGLVPTPYPIGFLNAIHIPYRIAAFSLRPYPPFIASYYSGMGWYYSRRRTWHGSVWSAGRPPVSINKKSVFQLGYQTKVRNGVAAWLSMTDETKDIYHHWRHPARAAGYHRFLSYYLKHTPVIFIYGDSLLLENGFRLLQESGGLILLEHFYLTTQALEIIDTESGDRLTGE